jgi:uncharacterized ferritin-like protein (DUF455 family)
MNLFSLLGQSLAHTSPDAKVTATASLAARLRGELTDLNLDDPGPPVQVGRPDRPALVHPARVPRRRIGTPTGHAALLHAVAHIEFNAINLALDAAYRFRGLPIDYYRAWVSIAAEEAHHFSLIREHLHSLGFDYGDFDAHDGLWQMALDTSHDPLVRMALVPRVLEARGLDVTPGMSRRLEAIGDSRGVDILAVIARDEVGHVAAGGHWFAYLCQLRGYEPESMFRHIVKCYLPRLPKGPFHLEARRAAGFSEDELQWLQAEDAHA